MITWTKATLLEQFRAQPNDQDANFYMLLLSEAGRRPVLYLGKTFDQYVSWRIEQPDHQDRLSRIQRKYPNADVLISVGVISSPDRNRFDRGFIDQIESLLILVHQPEFNDNKRSFPTITTIMDWHYVVNSGDFSPLERVVYFGPAVGGEGA